MAQTLIFENFPISNIAEVSTLAVNADAGQATMTPENTDRLDEADAILLIGSLGDERAEKGIVLSESGGVITLNANLGYDHLQDERVYRIRSDQVKIYRADNVDGSVPADDDFTLIQTVSIQFDQLQGEYVDEDGSSDYWYKYTYYNSFSAEETSLAESTAARGASDLSDYVSVDSVREEAGLRENYNITDKAISGKILVAQGMVNSSLQKAGYTLPLEYVPDVIEQITLTLATGLLLRSRVLNNDEAIIGQGNAMVEEAQEMLKSLESGDLLLFDSSGALIPTASKVVSTAFTDTTIEPWFTRDKKY